MDHSNHAGGVGGTSVGSGVPSPFYIQKIYWVVIGAAIAFATLVNVLNKVLALQRYNSQQAKPRSLFWQFFATATAIGRELTYASFCTFRCKRWSFAFPTLGRASLVLANTVVVLVLCFYKLKILDPWSWEDIGYRTGFVSIAQLPLIFLLAGKDNIVGFLTGVGYERLNWLHRWTARTLWLSVTLHMGFWFRNWARYDYINVKMTRDIITQRGFAAWCILTFVVVASVAPMRRINYEVFVIVHLITFIGFIVVVWLHVPDEVRIWVWLPIAIFALDRLLRVRRILYNNFTPFRFWKSKVNGLWANSASFTPLRGGVTRITIQKPVFAWQPGQHVFLSCHSVVPLQSHPLTIASLPSDGKLEFLVKAHHGGTKAFLKHATKNDELPMTNKEDGRSLTKVCIEGPYGRMRDLGQFDSVIFFAGSTGATFTMPLMRYLVQSWQFARDVIPRQLLKRRGEHALTRRIRFVWVVKSREQLDWFREQLEQVIEDTFLCSNSRLEDDRQVDVSVYVTCDEELVGEKSTLENCCQPREHGQAEEAESASCEHEIAGKEGLADAIETISVDSSGQTSHQSKGCAPGGTCCCRTIIGDESDAPMCTCSQNIYKVSASTALTTKPAIESRQLLLAAPIPPLKLLSGRPQPRSIISKVLEEAEGESAVIVCGPRGLQTDVRKSVVALSDERAVHKGTGAQGIYLHIEGFDY